MKVAFRADASLLIGSGHVMRCLTLAEALEARGAQCHFISREHPGHLLATIEQRGFAVTALPPPQPDGAVVESDRVGALIHAPWLGCDWQTDAQQSGAALARGTVDWLVVDHYALDQSWEAALRSCYRRLLVIDDLADRAHQADLLLDQNLGRQPPDYAALVPPSCQVLAGPRYALLRPEFAAMRAYSLQRRQQPKLQQLLITMGGVDLPNATGQVLQALKTCALPQDCRISVVMGAQAPWLAQVREQARDMPWPTEVLVDISDMAQRMADSDLAIGAAGGTSWERSCLGLPTLLVVLADNQHDGAVALEIAGAVLAIGAVHSIVENLCPALDKLQRPGCMQGLIRAGSAIVDGLGLERVTECMLSERRVGLRIRHAQQKDELLLFEWANDTTTRLNAFSSAPIALPEHQAWLTRCLSNVGRCYIFIVENLNAEPIGQVRLELDLERCWTIDYAIAPCFRGKGFGTHLLRMALDELRLHQPDSVAIGRVKLSNVPSCRVFEDLNFIGERDESMGTIIYRRVI